jgi:hypothetical protein
MGPDEATTQATQNHTVPLPVETYRQDRMTTVVCLIGCLVFLAIFIGIKFNPSPMLHEKDPESFKSLLLWLTGPLFAAAALVFSVRLFRPVTLTLDPAGFSVTGGIRRVPKRWLWRDIEPFFLIKLNVFSSMVAFNCRSDHRRIELVSGLRNAKRRADIVLGTGWCLPGDRLLERLEDYRQRALGLQPSEQGVQSGA